MPGIVGYTSKALDPASAGSRVAAMAESIRHQPWYRTVEAGGVTTRCAAVHLGTFDHGVTASTEDVGVVLDGWLFDWSPARDQDDAAEYCLREYLDRGIEFVRTLNGQFSLLIWDDRDRTTFLVSDRYGTRPWQYFDHDGTLYFAPEAKAILAACPEAGQLNMRALVNQLSWGRIWIGRDTLFKDVFMLEPATILRWQGGQIVTEQYWDYVYRPARVDDAFVDEAVGAFRRAVKRQTRSPLRYGVSLSGGLDSRTVLAALVGERDGPHRAYTWGVSESHDELAIARQTAERLGVEWHYVALAPGDFISNALQGVFLTEGLDLAVQSYGLKAYPPVREGLDVLLTGLAMDLTLGGSYVPAAPAGGEGKGSAALEAALERAALFTPEECRRLFRMDGAADMLEDLRGEAARVWEGGSNAHPADRSDRFFLRTRVWRYTFLRQAWQRFYVEDLAPSFDNEFVDCLLRIPPEWRAGHRFYQAFLERLEPAMMDIPYQRTMLPPSAPLEFWEAGARLEQQREQLYRDVWRATDGRVAVPYRRFFTNYDEWLRSDPAWIAMTDDLLLGSKSLCCDAFLDRESVARLVAEHRSGARAHHQRIIPLMTVELFLRAFVDRDRRAGSGLSGAEARVVS